MFLYKETQHSMSAALEWILSQMARFQRWVHSCCKTPRIGGTTHGTELQFLNWPKDPLIEHAANHSCIVGLFYYSSCG